MSAPLFLLFIVAALTAALLTPLIIRVAWAVGAVTHPVADRWHDRPTPRLGGIAIFGGVVAGLIALVVRRSGPLIEASYIEPLGRPTVAVLIAAGAMFLAGLADDRWSFRPATKLVQQTLAAATLVTFGVIFPITSSVPFNVLATLFWFIAITNAVNLLDNMDGVAVGVAGLAAGFLAIAFAREQAWLLTAVCVCTAGACAGFLPFNFHRARIFMGDSGSLFLGALLAGLGAAFPHVVSGSVISVLTIPVLVVVIPIADTLLVTVSRTLAGRPVSMGGRDHTTHRLVALGLSQRETALIIYGFATAAGAGALMLTGSQWGMWLAVAFVILLSVFAAYLIRTHTYEVAGTALGQPGTLTVMVTDLLHKRRALEVILDLVLFSAAHWGAYLLRYDGAIPATQFHVLELTLAVAVAAKLVGFLLVGVYRGMWQHVSTTDVLRLIRGTAFGSLLTVAAFVFLFREMEFARSIFLIDAMLVFGLTSGVRLSYKFLDVWRKATLQRSGETSLIYGAGSDGEMLLRNVAETRAGLHMIGFVDDNSVKQGRLIHGLPVLGTGADLPRILADNAVRTLVVAAPLSDDKLRQIAQTCRRAGVDMLRMEIYFRSIGHSGDGPPRSGDRVRQQSA